MHKSNTNSEKIFDNNNENIKTIEKLPQVKLSDSSLILPYIIIAKLLFVNIPNWGDWPSGESGLVG